MIGTALVWRGARTWLHAAGVMAGIAGVAGIAAADSGAATGPAPLGATTLARMTHLGLDQPPAVEAPITDAPTGTSEFGEGTWCWQAYGSALFGDTHKGEQYSAHVGFGYYFQDYSSINVDFFGAYVDSGIDDNGAAIGLDVIYRAHFYRSDDDRMTVYFDAGVGLQQASTNFSGERHFNFRLPIGFGASFRLDEQTRLIMAARYIHISDAGITGGGGGFDGPILYAGIMVPF